MKLLLTSFLLTLSISAAGLTGKWTGTFVDNSEGNKSESAVMILTQDGNTLTGTAGPTADEQMAISNGKVDAANITSNIKGDEDNAHFALQLKNNDVKGQATAEVAGDKHSGPTNLTGAE